MDGDGPILCEKYLVQVVPKRGWKCTKVSLKISCGVTQVIQPYGMWKVTNNVMRTGFATFNTDVNVGRICVMC